MNLDLQSARICRLLLLQHISVCVVYHMSDLGAFSDIHIEFSIKQSQTDIYKKKIYCTLQRKGKAEE